MRTTLNLDDVLVQDAFEATGLTSKTELVHRALRELIQREAGRRLIALGGSMPNLVLAERDRLKPQKQQLAKAEPERDGRRRR